MGAYAPAPIQDDALRARIHQTVLQPAIDGMRAMKMPYVGVLYAGLMISPYSPPLPMFLAPGVRLPSLLHHARARGSPAEILAACAAAAALPCRSTTRAQIQGDLHPRVQLPHGRPRDTGALLRSRASSHPIRL